MNKKGFAISGMIYTILLLFMMLIVMMLFNLQNRKMVLDEIKEEVVEAVEKDNEMELILKRIEVLENATNTFIKSHPVGSIYVTVASDEASVSMMNNKYTGSTWEAYGSGRTLVGVGSNGESEYLKSDLTGGKSNISLTVNNLPAHSHVIPALSGTTNSTGAHQHSLGNGRAHAFSWGNGAGTVHVAADALTGSGTSGNPLYTFQNIWSATDSGGSHNHTLTTTASSTTTCTNCASSSFSTQDPYITVYMYKRIS